MYEAIFHGIAWPSEIGTVVQRLVFEFLFILNNCKRLYPWHKPDIANWPLHHLILVCQALGASSKSVYLVLFFGVQHPVGRPVRKVTALAIPGPVKVSTNRVKSRYQSVQTKSNVQVWNIEKWSARICIRAIFQCACVIVSSKWALAHCWQLCLQGLCLGEVQIGASEDWRKRNVPMCAPNGYLLFQYLQGLVLLTCLPGPMLKVDFL